MELDYTDEAEVIDSELPEDIVPQDIRKPCISCGETKSLTEYYKHPQMGDGHLNKCKECCKRDNIANRNANIEHYVEYDRKRSMLPHRVQARVDYANTEHGQRVIREINRRSAAKPENKSQRLEDQRQSRTVNKKRHYAREQVAYAVKMGRLIKPDNCESCGKPHPRIEGHHPNYNHPLDVMWLCKPCHTKWHDENEAIY